ncbi:Eukaryotic translation initiation factor 3 subunit G [Porphyridium purpureum]|uniref:Eukaryotic translation initiation factor 3 subunit G n=1 Tax=Porphyridium purpureum TaxID=35688 RepID=A0A5J4ZAC4_PORPP|nr:Eukaryotic translation initiation factor 3 subunit G [Porphyridium purpureum]|eukprot:POR8325..scf295_1
MAAEDWADDEDDEFRLPPREVTTEANGLKKVVEWSVNDQHYAVKTTKVVREEKSSIVVTEGEYERMQWKKFGSCKNQPRGLEKGISTMSVDEILIDWVTPKDEEDDESEEEDQAKRELDIRKMLAADRLKRRMEERNAGVGNWAQLMAVSAGAKVEDLNPGQGAGAGGKGDKYIPPWQRNREAGAAGAGSAMNERDDSTTVRVSNVPPRTTEADLQELFSPFGRIQRIFLSRDRVTGESKGFAYVAYNLISEAAAAIQRLDGHGYDHLILRVEWAADTRGRRFNKRIASDQFPGYVAPVAILHLNIPLLFLSLRDNFTCY